MTIFVFVTFVSGSSSNSLKFEHTLYYFTLRYDKPLELHLQTVTAISVQSEQATQSFFGNSIEH